jgi:iron complex outermembrane receptor protein
MSKEREFTVSLRARRARRALAVSLIGMVSPQVAFAAPMPQSDAAAPAERLAFNIAENDLEAGLQLFAEQAGVQLVVQSSTVRGLKAHQLIGRYTREQALEALIGNADVVAEWIKPGTVTIRPVAKARMRPAAMTVAKPAAATPVSADDQVHEANVIEEIVITAARRRNESAQSTPIAIAAIGAAQLERGQITNIESIKRLTPSLEIRKASSSADVVAIFLRGFGVRTNDPTVNPAVSINVDGIYQSTVNGNMIDLFDVETVEVFKGPQGTLLGKNSPSGALSVTTKRPTGNFDGKIDVKLENYGRVEFRGLLNVPLIPDVLAAKASVLVKKGGNYIKNYDVSAIVTDPITGFKNIDPSGEHERIFGGDNAITGRLGLLFTPSENFDWYLVGSVSRFRSPQTPTINLSVNSGIPTTPRGYEDVPIGPPLMCAIYQYCEPAPKYSTAALYTRKNRSDTVDVTSIANFKTEPVTFTSVTGYKHYNGHNFSDVDAMPPPLFDIEDQRLNLDQFSQEIRIASNKDGGLDLNGKLDWILGAYYFYQNFTFVQPLRGLADLPFGFYQEGTQHQRANSYALFSHLEYHITEPWAVTFGARQTWDDKRGRSTANTGAPEIFSTESSSNFSIEAGTSYKVDRDKLIYFRYAEGYRGGGLQSLPSNQAGATPYRPETVTSYELGVKTEWFDRHLRLNVDLFYSKYRDLQQAVYVPVSSAAAQLVVQNAANAVTKGFEVETIVIPTERLTLRGSVGHLRTKFQDYFTDALGLPGSTPRDNSGFKFAYSPKWSAGIGGDLILADADKFGKVTLTADYNYTGPRNLTVLDFPAARAKSLSLVDMGLRWDDPARRYAVTLYGHNIFNKYYFVAIEQVSGLITNGIEGTPRMYGVTFSANF